MRSGVRAEWHIADHMADTDPFADMLHTTGLQIDLTTADDAELIRVMAGLLRREGNLYDRGVTCLLKDGGQDCGTCTHVTTDEQLIRLCRVGKDEVIINDTVRQRHEQKQGPLAEFAAAVEAASEVGFLPPDLAEALTGVGL